MEAYGQMISHQATSITVSSKDHPIDRDKSENLVITNNNIKLLLCFHSVSFACLTTYKRQKSK